MKTTKIFATFVPVSLLLCVSSIYGADGFESVRCGSDVTKAMIGKKTSNERVVVIEARHKDLQLKHLGADEISDRLNLIFWLICGEEYAVLEDGDFVRDVLKFPKHSKDSPQFVGSCQLNGKDLPGFAIGVLKNEEGAAMLAAVSAWKIDEKQKNFIEMKTEGLRCGRDGIVPSTAGVESGPGDEAQPVGLHRDVAEAQDEYDTYIPGIHGRLIHRISEQDLFDHLWKIETEHMGLFGNRGKTQQVVKKLLLLNTRLESTPTT